MQKEEGQSQECVNNGSKLSPQGVSHGLQYEPWTVLHM